jgi:hypothetical protein
VIAPVYYIREKLEKCLLFSRPGLYRAVNREFEMGPSTIEFESCSRRTPAWTPVNMSAPSTREDREFASETRGPKPNQRHFEHSGGRTASNRRTARKPQKPKNVRDMRGLAGGDAVN